VYRDFTRVGAGKTPDAKTMGRWGVAVGPEAVKRIRQRLVKLAQANGLAAGRRMRVDTTVVETNVHYPTDSSLLGDGVRVLIRTMKRIGKIAGETGARITVPQSTAPLHLVPSGEEVPNAVIDVVIDRPIGLQPIAVAEVRRPSAQKCVEPIGYAGSGGGIPGTNGTLAVLTPR
jgi:hypothetical protein